MKSRYTAFSAVDLLFVISCIALLFSIGVPTSSRARELAKRRVCGINLKGIGVASRIYATANDEQWPIPPFKSLDLYNNPIDYLNDLPTTNDWTGMYGAVDEGAVGYLRQNVSNSNTSDHPGTGSRELSTTRAFWLLVRSGDVTLQQFVCPSTHDSVDDTELLDLYYDFLGYTHISYGYQVPFGPSDTQARTGADNRQIFAADKGPWYLNSGYISWTVPGTAGAIALDHPPSAWRRFNSPNHGGRSNSEGQNCLYADGHTSFHRKPTAGIDHDNIYTIISGTRWATVDPEGAALIYGWPPWTVPIPYPGRDAFGNGPNLYSSTDTLIYP